MELNILINNLVSNLQQIDTFLKVRSYNAEEYQSKIDYLLIKAIALSEVLSSEYNQQQPKDE